MPRHIGPHRRYREGIRQGGRCRGQRPHPPGHNCVIDGRLVTSADKYGTLVTKIDLKVDPRTRDIFGAQAENMIVRTDVYAKDAEQTALIAPYEKLAKPLASRGVGSVTATLLARANDAGESALGNIIAEAQLAATADGPDSAVIAF